MEIQILALHSSVCSSRRWLTRVIPGKLLVVAASLICGACRDRHDSTPVESKPTLAVQAVTTTSGPNCSASGDPTLGVDIGYSCTGALAAATFTRALCACGTIQDSNSLVTDGFDSTKGGVTGGLGADVAANTGVYWSTTSSIGGTLWTPGNVSSSNPSTVRGDLRLGGTLSGSGTFTINGNAYVVKTLPSFAKVIGKTTKVTTVANPCNCTSPIPIATITAAHKTNNDNATIGLSTTALVGNNPTLLDLPCGNYYLTQINAAQPLTIAVHGHTALYVDGNVQASQSLKIQPDASATLDLFVAGTFYAAQSFVLGSTSTPERCRLYVSGSNFVTSGNTTYGCNVYAPNALITLSNNAAVYGSLFAGNIQTSGNTTVHFDTSIGSAGSECCTAASCDDANPCTVDSCNGDGTCAHSPAVNGSPCNDGNACTQTDTCQAGSCTGSNPVTCTASDQCHTAGTCNTANGTCSNPAIANGTACNDGNGCTQSDTCQAGVCTGSNPVTCVASDQCHTAGTCNATTGVCTNPAKIDGTACDDGNECTQSDSCQTGVCKGSNPITCVASDQCHAVGVCDSATGLCSNPAAANGTPCNDGNACTQTDSCQVGLCVGSNAIACVASDQCHVAGICNPGTGTCSNPSKPDGSACSDSDACTQSDTCQLGACIGSNPVVCVAKDLCHEVGTCNTSTGQCSDPVKADGSACNDGNACTQSDSCQSGACTGANPVACAAADQCHEVGSCDPASGACSNPTKANGTACNDGNACTQSDTCQSGTCTGSSPVVCVASDQCHNVGTCDVATGQCSNPSKTDGTACNDGNACTLSDSCQSGTCTGANPVACAAADQCHDAGSCDPASGACSNPAKADGTACNDGNACTQSDSCQAGTCTGSNLVICAASDQCHDVGACDTSTGQCSNPAKANGSACNDGDACTQTDACQLGTCTGTNPVACAAADQCHDAGSCDPTSGTCSNPAKADGSACNDGNACTQSDSCQSGTCTGSNPVVCATSDQCHDVGTCDGATGQCSNPAKSNGTACNDGNACTQTDSCQAGTCTGSNPVACTALDVCHEVGQCDVTTGVCSNPLKVQCQGGLPPDPALEAPPLNRTVVNTVYEQTQFLYSGSPPVQTGVASNTIDQKRVCELRGKVMLDDGTAESGVTITVVGHPEFGQTLSRIDGLFDMVVNGGGPITLDYRKSGYLSVQRTITCPWQQYASVPTVVLIPPDPVVTTINAGSSAMQVARGSVVTDEDGTRQPTAVFPPGTQATAVMPDGTTTPLSTLSVRITEYTVGTNGDKRMPADLPPNSAYTHAFEVNADEAVAAGATQITFNQPVYYYVDNFLGYPAGTIVPVGSYQRGCSNGTCVTNNCGTWVPSQNGVVINILSVTSGTANIDSNGDNVVDSTAVLSSAGITAAELQTLAQLYAPGKSIWRAPLPHFSAWDCNWGWGPPDDAVIPNAKDVVTDVTADCRQPVTGGLIDTLSQTVAEIQPIVGTPYNLVYQSDHEDGRSAEIQIPLSGETVPQSLKRIELEVTALGKTYTQTFPSVPNLTHRFKWDGTDVFGRRVQGAQPLAIRIGFVYDATPQKVVRFGYNGNGTAITGLFTRQELTLWRYTNVSPLAFDVKPIGLGGWNPDVHHTYDPSGVLHKGDGTSRAAKQIGGFLSQFAGGGPTPALSATNALSANFGDVDGITIAQDGSVYVIDHYTPAIYRIFPSGAMARVAGTGTAGYNGDEISATQAQINPYIGRVAMARECDGGFYFADYYNNRVRYVDGKGIIHTVLGTGSGGYTAEGVPALQDPVSSPRGLAVAPDGSLYVTITGKILHVSRDGMVSYAGGKGDIYDPTRTDGILATKAPMIPNALAVGPDGSIYVSDAGNYGYIRKIGTDGIIRTIAGGGAVDLSVADGIQALQVRMGSGLQDVSIGADGTVYFCTSTNNVGNLVMAVLPSGIMRLVAGTGPMPSDGNASLSGPAKSAWLMYLNGVAVAPDNKVYTSFSSRGTSFITRIGSPLPELGSAQFAVGSEDGRELYLFDNAGRHQSTRETMTGATKYTFGYDGSGLLTSITDATGKTTQFLHDASGNPSGIVAPRGQTTTLTNDTNGYLASITNPAGETIRLEYSASQKGLLTTFGDAENNEVRFQYDAAGRLIHQEDMAEGSTNLTGTRTSGLQSVSRTTALGLTSSVSLQALAPEMWTRVSTLPSGLKTTRIVGATITTKLPNGTVTTELPDSDPRFGSASRFYRLVTVSTPGGLTYQQNMTRTVALSNPQDVLSLTSLTETITTDSSNAKKFTNTYAASSKTWSMTTPAARNVAMTLDSLGRIATARIGTLASEVFTYDGNGMLASIKQNTRIRTLSYDGLGMLASVTDPMSHTTTYVRDSAGRVIQQTLTDGQVVQLGYDLNGNVASLTPPGRPMHLFSHDARGQLLRYAAPAVDGNGSATTQYTYDADGRLSSVANPDGSGMSVTYDFAGRISATAMSTGAIAYTYSNTTGRLASASGPDTQQVTYGYDGILQTDEAWAGVVNGKLHWGYDKFLKPTYESLNNGNAISYAYDDDGLMTKVGQMTLVPDASNGIVTSTTLRSITDNLTYDTYGKRANYSAKYQATPLLAFGYTRDSLGRLLTKTETLHAQTHTYSYAYDARNRLIDVKLDGVAVGHYDYDANSNRTSAVVSGSATSATYDVQDRVISQGAFGYTYDSNGELRAKVNSSTNATTRYLYDAMGNLIRVELPDGKVVEYVVDAVGRRVAKKVDGNVVRQWIYRNETSPAAELDSNGNLTIRFAYADNVIGNDSADQALMERLGLARASRNARLDRARPMYIVRNGQTMRVLTDHLGSPRLVVDADSGAVVQELQYDEWGNVVLNTAPDIQPLGFAGGLYDADTKLVRFGARDYDPETGRWLAKEPMKAAGTLNLYEYAGSDPVNNVDVDGLAKVDCSSANEVGCEDKAAQLDSICGPNAQGELHCYQQEFTHVIEHNLSGLGASGSADTDTTVNGVVAGANETQSGGGAASLSASNGNPTSNGGPIGTGVGTVAVNQPPTVTIAAPTVVTLTLPARGYASTTFSGTVTDDGLPFKNYIYSHWLVDSGPLGGAAFTNAFATTTDAVVFEPGTYNLALAATDGEYIGRATCRVIVLPHNEAPVVWVSGPSQVGLGNVAHMVGAYFDDEVPVSSHFTWSMVSGPGIVTFSNPNYPISDALFSEVGTYVLQLTADDTQLTGSAQLAVNVVITDAPPVVNAGPDQTLASASSNATLLGTVTDDGYPIGSTLAYAWVQVGGPANAKIVSPNSVQTLVNLPYPGNYAFRLTASDGELAASDDVAITLQAPNGNNTPSVKILTPADDAVVTKPSSVTGSVSEGAWVLTYRLGGRDDVNTPWKTIASGTGAITGALGTFDPTQLLNGTYTIRLASTTSAGELVDTVAVAVDGRMKVGNFTLSFQDLDIPVGNVPMQLIRTYDSREAHEGRVGDFGTGWSLAIRNVRIEKSGVTGAHWVQNYIADDFFPQFCLETVASAMVTITMPNGRVYRFKPVSYPHCQTLYPLTAADVSWESVSDPGNPAISLQAVNGSSVFVEGPAVGPVQFITPDFDVWDPRQFTLTTEDGSTYDIDQDHGLQQLTDRNGNYLQITDQGILHSSGLNITFQRDAQNRITRVIDPAGNSMNYQYDWRGDLIGQQDREGYISKYTYSLGHYLETIQDPLGRTPIRNEYDANGRLAKHIDALGHEVVYTHLLASNQEQIVDRLGNLTLYDYNDQGDIIRKTDALGNAWNYEYDTYGNQTKAVDPLGNATTKTYSWHYTLLSETNALGETRSNTYNDSFQLLTTTDAAGNLVVSNVYGVYSKNLESTTDARGATTDYIHDTRGNRTRETDAMGNQTNYVYDASGNITRKTDALGNSTTYVYDSNKHKVSETVTRVVGAATETLTTSYQYDKNGRNLKTTYPDGTATTQTWNANGQRLTSTDGGGNRTQFEYDQSGRLIKTTDPDGGVETIAYDAENHRTSRTDAMGRVTKYAYDALGRVTTTTAPDNTTTKNVYDQAGNLVSTTNEAGKTTTYAYDATNRRISTSDPLGNTTYSIFDTVGRQIETIAPNSTAIEYVYNDAGDLLETHYPNAAKTTAEYDILGRQTSKTDELGHKTTFTYDPLGRLTSVTDAANQTTHYTYDELGNQLTQTDANGRITHFAYDTQNRLKERMLPDGTSEARTYDDAGRMTSKSDNAGNTIVYDYNLKGQEQSRTYPDWTQVSFAYDLSGLRTAMRDTRGKTSYTYDARGHIKTILYPDGRELDYTYDPRGMRSTITAKIGTKVLTTTTTYDNAGRLSTVTDPLNRAYGVQYDVKGNRSSLSYPNNEATSYTYDTRGHLTSLVTKQPGANGTVAQSYAYTLDVAGKRTSIQEADGTIRQYGYDSVDRLTSESVTGPTPYTNSFGYDSVGNRLTQTSTGNHPGTVNYTYDTRDELTKENSTAYTYDKNGNVTAKIGEAGYTWDVEHRLTQVSLIDGTTIDHVYDMDGNRVQTKVTPPGGTPVITNYLVDTSGNLSQVVAESDGTGALTAVYVRAYDELLAVMRPTGTTTWATRYVHSDGLGSVRVLTDETGNVTDTRDYEAFGVRNESTGSDSLAFGFAGEPFENLSKLAYHRARWMDPRVGRFVSVDPLLSRSVDLFASEFDSDLETPGGILFLHPYRYASDNATNETDPNGLMSMPEISAGSIGQTIMSTLARTSIQLQTRAILFYTRLAAVATPSARALANALEENGQIRPSGYAAHHIVAATARLAQPAREVLLKYGVNLDEYWNGVFLPAGRQALQQGYAILANNPAIHSQIHTERYYKAVNDLLLYASSREDVIAALQQIKYAILSGGFP